MLVLTSPAFAEGATIPAQYTEDGENVSPPLEWKGAPEATRSFALIVDDPDAPDPKHPKTTWVHWVVVDLPPDAHVLAAGASGSKMPRGAHEGRNDWKREGWGGPAPPIGRHRYIHKLYALDTTLPNLKHPTKHELEQAMQGHVLAEAKLIGTYARG
ncbi:MAG: YbhB/YbcL family Raf kinase inhibitor-like protein [Deltaproteobacteria bacterium]|nr:YbhB/YbcL family Raf kinase inhibitor-like protein [Deltaproteobacteria bacterium]